MYLTHYGLQEKPFKSSPDPKYLWLGARQREALSALVAGVLGSAVALIGTAHVLTWFLLGSVWHGSPQTWRRLAPARISRSARTLLRLSRSFCIRHVRAARRHDYAAPAARRATKLLLTRSAAAGAISWPDDP